MDEAGSLKFDKKERFNAGIFFIFTSMKKTDLYIILLLLVLMAVCSCKTCNCPAYTNQQVQPAETVGKQPA